MKAFDTKNALLGDPIVLGFDESQVFADLEALAFEGADWGGYSPGTAALKHYSDPRIIQQCAPQVSDYSDCDHLVQAINPSNGLREVVAI